jgi:predicted kinase
VATLHLISGLPCSGKTTYSRRLRAEVGGVLFSLDRWLITAYDRYSIADIGHDEHVRRVLATRELIWDASAEFLNRDIDVILDDGLFWRENRIDLIARAKGIGAAATIHFVNTPLELIVPRLIERNANLPRYNFNIEPELLENFVSLFETPTADEGAELVVVTNALSQDAVPSASRD